MTQSWLPYCAAWVTVPYFAVKTDAQRPARKEGDMYRQGSRHLAILRIEWVK